MITLDKINYAVEDFCESKYLSSEVEKEIWKLGSHRGLEIMAKY